MSQFPKARPAARGDASEDAGEDPDRWLVIGPDCAGNLLEVLVLITIEGAQLAIRAMGMRAKFRRLIEP
jgi:hypothetical protein